MSNPNENPTRKKYSKRRILFFLGLAIVLAVVVYFGSQWVVDRFFTQPEVRGDAELRHTLENRQTINVNGTAYALKNNLTSILLMGVDKYSDAEPTGSYRNGGQADFLRLLVIDSNAKKVIQIAIDRDTITPITILNVFGNPVGTRNERISLSHGFGDGKEQSCELTLKAVKNLLFDAPVDFYIAMNMDGISDLNDLLGGVTVTLEDDFSSVEPTMTKGKTLTLVGDQAEVFVRSRMSIGIGTNEARMKRQETYLNEAQDLLRKKMGEDKNAVGDLFDGMLPYLTTNIARGRLVNEAYAAQDYDWSEVLTANGQHAVDSEGFTFFTVDQKSLQDIVLSVFYEKVG